MNVCYQEQKPSQKSSLFVDHYWQLKPADSFVPALDRVLPDGFPEIVFNLGERMKRIEHGKSYKQDTAIVIGQMLSSVDLIPSKNFELFGIRLKPFGLHLMTGIPASNFAGEIVPISDVFGPRGKLLHEKVACASSFSKRIEVFEEEFVGTSSIDVAPWVLSVDENASTINSKWLASQSGKSVKTIQRTFRKAIGLSPKKFQRIRRIQNVVAHFEEQGGNTLTDVAYENGFFDQSHFIKDFRLITGQSPGEFLDQYDGLTEAFAR